MNNVYIKKEHLNRWVAKYFPSKDLISVDDLLSTIEELDGEVSSLKEKIEDMEQDIKENYKRIPVSEQIGISDRDFI